MDYWMKKAKGLYAKVEHDAIFHKTSIGRNPSKCKMNKHKRRSFKKYRGQGWQISCTILYIQDMKELIEYNKSLLEIADQKLKRLIETEHDINHPGPYFDMVNKQLDYVNTLKERINFLNERKENNNK